MTSAELEELKSRPGNSCAAVAARLGARLRRYGREQIGPCPICSDDLSSKHATRWQTKDGGWVCAVCEDGGDVIRLVERALKRDFKGAVDWLGGPREIDSVAAEKAAKVRAAKDDRRRAESERYRQREQNAAQTIYDRAEAPQGTIVETYLSERGIPLPTWDDGIPRLRYVPDMAYFHGHEVDEFGRKSARVIHRGPAMVAAIVREGLFCGAHVTYLDPCGTKLAISDPDTGAALPAKKVRGSKRGGYIELVPPAADEELGRVVLGEGIETVLSVWHAMRVCGHDVARTGFWSAIDLGNLGGKAHGKIAHPTLRSEKGRRLQVPGPAPDLSERGIVLPLSVKDLTLLMDGDSEPVLTACAMHRATKRYARDGRTVRTAVAPAGKDFNDILPK